MFYSFTQKLQGTDAFTLYEACEAVMAKKKKRPQKYRVGIINAEH